MRRRCRRPRSGLLRYKIAPKCLLPGPFGHFGVGGNPGVVGTVRSYNLVFTYPCQRGLRGLLVTFGPLTECICAPCKILLAMTNGAPFMGPVGAFGVRSPRCHLHRKMEVSYEGQIQLITSCDYSAFLGHWPGLQCQRRCCHPGHHALCSERAGPGGSVETGL